MRTAKFSSSTGASIIEAALTVPILLAILFIFIWGAYIWNARTSFYSAVDNAPRLALTRYNEDRTGTIGGTITDFNTFVATPPGTVPAGFERALYSLPSGGSMLQAEQFYDVYSVPGLVTPASPGTFRRGFLDSALNPIPSIYHYAIAFVNLAMVESVGTSLLSYPCNPYQDSDSNSRPDPETDGCLACIFLDASGNGNIAPPAGGFPLSPAFPPASFYTFSANPYPADSLIMECHYRPAGLLTSSIFGLLGALGAPDMSVWVERASIL